MERTDLEQWKARDVARLLALVENERRYYQEIIATLPVGLIVLSADLSLVSANRAIRKIFGLRSGESIREHLDSLLPKPIQNRVREVLATGSSQTGILANTPLNGGRTLRLGIQALHNWGDECQREALLTIEDITELRTGAHEPDVQDRLPPKTSEPPRADELLDNLDAAIWTVDVPSMKFLFVNAQGRQLLGFDTRHWLDSADFWGERIHSEDRDSVIEAYRAAVENPARPAGLTVEYRAIRADDRIIWIYETARILRHADGRARYVAGLSIDVSERRRLEDQVVRSNRVDAVGKLAARMAQDLNNTLMIVSGYAEEVLHGLPPENPLRADAREIVQAADRVTVLTNQMLSFTRYRTTPSEAVELNGALLGMERSLREALGPRIVLECLPAAEPLVVNVEPPQLHQVINAFVRHARETIPEHGRLTMRVSKTSISGKFRRPDATLRPGDYAVLTVQDTGRQHDAETRAAMFESFLPGKDSTEEAGPALARAYALVRQWEGDISVANAPASGSVFEVLLPLATAEARAQPAFEEPASPAGRAETILVVEDEAGIRALMSKILRREGFEVLEAESGKQAHLISSQRGHKIDLLITDVVMPEMSGRELVRRLRSERRDLKVLYVSGYTDEPSVYAERLPPDTAYLQKPFTLGSLIEKVRQSLAAKSR